MTGIDLIGPRSDGGRTSTGTIVRMDPCFGKLYLVDFRYTGHKMADYQIDSCLSADNRLVVGGSVRGDVMIWDLLTGRDLTRLPHGSTVVHSVSAHPKAEIFLSAATNTVKLWLSEQVQLDTKQD